MTGNDFDLDELEAWLKSQPREVSLVIAARAVLRVTPLLVTIVRRISSARTGEILLPAFRATAVACVAGEYGLSGEELGAKNAARAALEAYRAANTHATISALATNATTVAKSAQAISDAARAAAAEHSVAADAARAVRAADVSHGATRLALQSDRSFIDAGRTATDLSKTPVWTEGDFPTDVIPLWEELRATLLAMEQDWEVWTDWYEDRIYARPANSNLEIARLTLPEEVWRQEPHAVNLAIKRLLEINSLKAQEQSPLGVKWQPSVEQFVAIRIGDSRDEHAVEEMRTQQLHQAARRKLEDFSKKHPEIEANYGWDGFESCLSRFETSLLLPLAEIPANIIGLYDAIVELGSYLDLHHDLLKRSFGNQSALDPIPARAFTDLVRTSALFVRSFPSALEADEEISEFLTKSDLFSPAITVIETAGRRFLISKEDADWMLGLLHAGQRDSFPSQKAGGRGFHGARNLAVSATTLIAGFLIGAVGSDYSTKSPLVQSAGDFLVDVEGEITELFTEGQADLRHSLASLIEESRNRLPTPELPNIAIENSSAKREEDDYDSPGGGGGGSWG
jgi:hypothetical protein